MDRININNLFPLAVTNRPLDINSLFNTKENLKENKINYDLDRLMNLRDNRKKRVLVCYEKIFSMCMTKIKIANNIYKTSIVYDLPLNVYGYNYVVEDCMQFVNAKLRELKFDTELITDGPSIYVSWEKLRENRQSKSK